MKYLILFLHVLLLISCAGDRAVISGQKVLSAEVEIEQRSVIDTEFDDSDLYQQFNQLRIEGPIIPGLMQPLVPQGMAYWKEKDLMIISNYNSDGSAGTLTIIKMDTGILEKVLILENHDGTPHTGHLGGLAVSREHLWIASGSGVYHISLNKLFTAENQEKIYLPEIIVTETKGSFATFSDSTLWIGEFTLKNGSYPVSEAHQIITPSATVQLGWLAGYTLDDETDMIGLENTVSGKVYPDFILSIPDKIQGAVFFENKILLSESYGRKNYSRLFIYDNPLEDKSNGVEGEPLWFLDGINKTGEIIVPPMSEAVVLYGNNIAVLFESAADKYRDTALFPLDRIQIFPVKSFITE